MKARGLGSRLLQVLGGVTIGVGLALALGLATLLGWLMIERGRPVVLPSPSGPYAVGRVAFDWVDSKRVETFADDGAMRELMVFVWYPAGPPAGPVTPAEYIPATWGRARELDRGIWAPLYGRFDAVRVHAVADAPFSFAERTYPVLIMSSGYGALPTDYTVLAEDMASHGYVVAGIASTYSAPVVVFPDGRAVRRVPEASIPEAPLAVAKAASERLVEVWAADAVLVLNRLQDLNSDPASPFKGRLDPEHVGVLGHSLGGAASAQACLIDSRFAAGIDIDGTLRGDAVRTGVRQPFLLVASEPPSAAMEWEDRDSFRRCLERGAYLVRIVGARHLNFSDVAVTFAPALRPAGLLGSIDGRRGLKITCDYVRAFFDRYLRDVDSPLLETPLPDYPEVRLLR